MTEREHLFSDSREVLEQDVPPLRLVHALIAEVAHDAAEIALVGEVQLHAERSDSQVLPNGPVSNSLRTLFEGLEALVEMAHMVRELLTGRRPEQERCVGRLDFSAD